MNEHPEAGRLTFEEISPEHLVPEQVERFASDIQRLLQHRHEFVAVPCPACESERGEKFFEKFGMTYLVCSDCETVYISPRPTPALLEMYYATSENYAYWNKYIFPASENARREKIFRPRVDRILEICGRHNVPRGVLLEVGAGFGTFCEELQRRNVFRRVIAVEPTPDLAQTCRNRGLEVIEKPIAQVHLEGGAVDVVASFEVIEHLFSPREFLFGCASVLAPGGLLVITCPNVKGFEVAVLGAISDTVDVEHLNYLHPRSLSNLLTKCGFRVLEAMTPGELDAELVRRKALAGEFKIDAHPFLKELLIDRWEELGDAFQRFLAENGLSSHMWLVARRV